MYNFAKFHNELNMFQYLRQSMSSILSLQVKCYQCQFSIHAYIIQVCQNVINFMDTFNYYLHFGVLYYVKFLNVHKHREEELTECLKLKRRNTTRACYTMKLFVIILNQLSVSWIWILGPKFCTNYFYVNSKEFAFSHSCILS